MNRSPQEIECARLQKELVEKEHTLRNLRSLQRFRQNNEYANVQQQISRWRAALQEAITELRDEHPEPRPSLLSVLRSLRINPKTAGYDADTEQFVEEDEE